MYKIEQVTFGVRRFKQTGKIDGNFRPINNTRTPVPNLQ